MPVTVLSPAEKSKQFALKFFGAISLNAQEKSAVLMEKGATITIAFTNISFGYKGTEFYNYPLPVNSTAVLKNAVPQGQEAAFSAGVLKALTEATVRLDLFLENGKWPGKAPKGVPVDIKPDPNADPPGVSSKVSFTPEGKLKVESPKVAGPEAGKWMAAPGSVPMEEPKPKPKAKAPANLHSQDPVPLKEATQLGQPVKGTGAGSVYYCIAISPKVKVAARILGNELSVRYEGALSSTQVTALGGLGFAQKGGTHVSNHYKGQAPQYVLGALLMMPEFNWTEKIGSLTEVNLVN